MSGSPAGVAADPAPGSPPLAVPPVPSFELPPGEPGVRNPLELRVMGEKYLDTEIRVKGYVTWIYDCAKEVARPNETRAQVQKRIDDDPTQCERPRVLLGEAKDTSPERSIWVVGVPRPPNKLERERLPKQELASWPAVPKVAVGDYVELTGRWALSSPHGERNSDGLLNYQALAPATPAPPAPSPAARPAPAAPPTAKPVVPRAPTLAQIDPAKRDLSIKQQNLGTQAYVGKRFDAAIQHYEEALKIWPENVQAWYGLTATHVARTAWAAASTTCARLTALAPDQAIYRLTCGFAFYEVARAQAREAQARAEGRRPEEVILAPGAVRQDRALAELSLAVAIDDRLWRAHYYRGRILRDRGDARAAAEAFSNAVRRAPPEAGPYVALADLYRRWNYVDQAIAAAQLGAALDDPSERADVLYMLGMASDDKRDDAAAIDAYTRAIDANPGLAVAYFMRGQAYARTSNTAAARQDLEAYMKHPSAQAFSKRSAELLLVELARKQPKPAPKPKKPAAR